MPRLKLISETLFEIIDDQSDLDKISCFVSSTMFAMFGGTRWHS